MKRTIAALCSAIVLAACHSAPPARANLILVNGNIYTLAWPDPSPADGAPAASAPHSATGWKGDAQAIAIRDGSIVLVGRNLAAQRYAAPVTEVIDLHGATVVPGLVDAHVHILELGRKLGRVDLVGVQTEAEAVERVAAWAAGTPPGSWVVGYGWDDGAWANRYPDMTRLSATVPDHPVYLRGLHGHRRRAP